MAFLLIAVKIIIWEIKIYLTLRISFEIIRAWIDIIIAKFINKRICNYGFSVSTLESYLRNKEIQRFR